MGVRRGRGAVWVGVVFIVAVLAIACDPGPGPIGSVVGPLDFEGPRYAVGDIGGQNGWRTTGSFDHEIDDVSAAGTRAADWGFGAQGLRLSDAETSGSFGDHTVSRPTDDHSGETTNGDVTGTRRGYFETSWSFATAGDPQDEQEDLSVFAAPDRGDGAHMSWVEMADRAGGLAVGFSEYDADAGEIVPASVATGLSRTSVHTIRLRMFFFDGADNDVVEVCVDGTTCVTGGSWEDYYRDVKGTDPLPVDSVAFGTEGSAAPARDGDGLFVEGFVAKSVNRPGPAVAVSGPATVIEGAAGTQTALYTVTLSEPVPIAVSVPYWTTDGTADAADYTPSSGTATLAPGATVATVNVPIRGDTTDEPHETFALRIGQPTTTGRGPGSPSGEHIALDVAKQNTSIRDDDSTIRLSDARLDEPFSGTASMPFTVALDNPSAVPVTMRFTTADSSAVAPADYTAVPDRTVTLSAGQTSKVVNVQVKADNLVEGDEDLTGTLHDPTNGVIADSVGTGVIEDVDLNDPRPNIVVVMTDDQTAEAMRFLPRTQTLLGDEGTTFINSFVNFPLCCPSRATFLTGQYMHNHGVLGNSPPDGGYHRLDHSNTLPVWLRDAGYTTAHVGKYLNGYGVDDPQERPPGWSEWYGLIDWSTYQTYGYRMNRNGVIKQYGSTPADYQTDVLADTAVNVVNRRVPEVAPFFLWVTPLAPHREGSGSVPIRPAPRHQGIQNNLPLPRPPNFDEANVSDKPANIRNMSHLTQDEINTLTNDYRREAESLLAVDEMVERIYNRLEASGELDNTVFVFTSDNGFFHGEHRLRKGKGRPHEEAIRVPLLVRGPGFTAGLRTTEPVINADLAPTVVSVSGVTPRRVMDGRSLLDRDPSRPLLLEAENQAIPFTAVRTTNWKWVEYATGERELYNIVNDPYELTSLHNDPSLASLRSDLAALLARLRACAGTTCRTP